jgi:hypothetical protein
MTFALINVRQGCGKIAERKAQNDLSVVLLFLCVAVQPYTLNGGRTMDTHHASAQTVVSLEQRSETETHLYGRRLVFARVVWGVIALLTLGLLIASIPTFFASLHVLCTGAPVTCTNGGQLTPNRLQAFRAVGLSLDFYATYEVALYILLIVVYAVIGAVIFWRRSDDRMALVASLALMTFPAGWGSSELATLPSGWWLPGQFAAFLGDISLFLFFYLFPTGRFVPRWTRWLWVAVIVLWAGNVFFPALPFNSSIFFPLLLLGFICSVLITQVYRYRRVSSPEQRQQTKWVVLGISIGLGGFLILDTFSLFFYTSVQNPLALLAIDTAYYLVFLLIPLSMGFALLRYRLWDVDVLINKALVYGLLTGTLIAVYAGCIIGVEALLRGLFHQTSEIAIVVSTILIYARFQPLRRRIQMVIDRRFYRRKYDAAKVIAAFSATLRTEVDLDQLREALVAVVQETTQPAHVSLWLRPPAQSRERNTQVLPRIEEEESIVP